MCARSRAFFIVTTLDINTLQNVSHTQTPVPMLLRFVIASFRYALVTHKPFTSGAPSVRPVLLDMMLPFSYLKWSYRGSDAPSDMCVNGGSSLFWSIEHVFSIGAPISGTLYMLDCCN
jgi:hypothetical protein